MTALPAVADATGATRNEGQFKAYMTSEHDYLVGLFGTDGVPATALATLGALGATYVAKTGAYTVVTGDRGKVIACSGTWTLGLAAVATLGAGFSCIIANTGSGTITIDPASAELVGGAATFALGPGRMVLIVCTGSAWITLALAGSVTTSSTDTTAERVMRTGDWGLGATLAPALPSSDFTAELREGFWRLTESQAIGYPTAESYFMGALVMRMGGAESGASGGHGVLAWRGVSSGAPGNQRLRFGTRTSNTGAMCWVEIIHNGRIVGAVSQSGGVPTGTVIERGSNANGEYVRFADGTQICWRAVVESSLAVTTALGTLYRSGDLTSLTFPATFAGAPVVVFRGGFATNPDGWLVVNGSPTATQPTNGAARAVGATSRTEDFRWGYVATGRWF